MNEKPTMLTFIKATPYQLSENTEHSKSLTKQLVDEFLKKEHGTIWIIASGSSNNGAQCAKPFMMKYLDCDVRIVSPSTFIMGENKLGDNDFAFVISQSGCSTNSIDALKKLKEMGFLPIGLTGNLESDFKTYAHPNIDYGVGIETVGYVTKGVATLAQFLMLFALESSLQKGIINDIEYEEVIDEMEVSTERHQYMQEQTWQFYEKNKKELLSMDMAYTIGFKQSLGIAYEGALKIGETIQIPSVAYEAEEFIHGPNLQITPKYNFFFIDDFSDGSKRLGEIFNATSSVSNRCYAISNNPDIQEEHCVRLPFEIKEPLLMPLYCLPFFQILSYQITDDLKRWDKHPLFDNFKKLINSKTDTIKDIMPNDD